MPLAAFPLGEIQSLQPALDARNAESIFALDGRNFAWTAAGPYAAFSSRLLAADQSIMAAPHIAQGIDLVDRVFVAAGDKIYRWADNYSWSSQNIVPIEPNPLLVRFDYRRWSSAYLKNGDYAAAKNYGFYKVSPFNVFTLKTAADIPGLPTDIVAIGEANGRLILMTPTTVYWSAQNAPETLTPSLGGAGLQVINARVSGDPIALTTIPNGFIVWTTESALVGEFIGGDNVYRFFEMTTKVLPLNAFCIEEMPDGSHVILTKTGLYRTVNGGQPTPMAQVFNEFIREFLRSQPDIQPMLTYQLDEQQLYVSFRSNTDYFTVTYVLLTTLDKWGMFSGEHLGIIKYSPTRGHIGYVDRNGIGHRWMPKASKFRRRELASDPGTYAGLDSSITVGYIRHPQLAPRGDSMQEIQEIVVYRNDVYSGLGDIDFDEGIIDEPTWIIVDELESEDLDDLAGADILLVDESADEILVGAALYEVEVIGEVFAFSDSGSAVMVPELGLRSIEADIWVGMSQSYSHRLRFSARLPGDYWELNTVRLTVGYHGELV